MCTNITLSKRKKRSEHNIVVEETGDDVKQWDTKDQYYRISEPDKETGMNSDMYDDSEMTVSHHAHHRSSNANHKKETKELSGTEPLTDELLIPDERSHPKKLRHPKIAHSKEKESKPGRRKNMDKTKTSKTKERKSHNTASNKRTDENVENDNSDDDETVINDDQETTPKEPGILEPPERDFAVYEIGHPELWYTVNVQLFEKLSTPDGKTVWNDLTKGEQARYFFYIFYNKFLNMKQHNAHFTDNNQHLKQCLNIK